MNIIKHTDFEIRAFAYEKAMTIPLAKLYFKFLKEASSEEDFAMRVNSIELRAGLSMTDVEELYGFFSGFLDE